MSSNKTLALALCLAITGCAQTPQNDAEGGHKWWQLGSSDEVSAPADKKVAAAAANVQDKEVTKPVAKAAATAKDKDLTESVAKATATEDKGQDSGFNWWPFGADSAKKDAPAENAKVAAAPAAGATSEKNWWWPFGSDAKGSKSTASKVVPMPDPKITQAWLDEYEPRLRAAIKGTNLQLERRESLLVIVAAADSSFKATRPDLLMPSMLGPFTRVAKVVEGDPKTAVLVLGHADASGAMAGNTKLSLDRARSVAAIFRMSGLQSNRLTLRGMGSVMPRAANDSNEGRALNRRVEILMTPQATMLALVSRYSQPALSPAELAAVQPAVVAPTIAKKKAPAKKKAVVAKKAAPAKKAAKPAAAKKPVVAKADTSKKVAANDQTKN
ncbi:Outer membrane protein OmpA [Pseudomonas taetrolens]|uniref:Membrane protein n=1 Tax=Pseudomonas taetrolens TaxID=47884 RepID=A0A0J6GWH9_PSETA|nr:OmpA family protein [Pseudomonas taetrolens]KMM86623.1 membrane protein [Pseudomonas taetrolens]SEB75215.1 Outer membrane protein OmpA [Pseudomonas taetrolens]SQF85284.1 OmpA family protein [Pseudomonas taetrolens]VEH48083.1 OmpA family protein [Pseudomonas taetrolens]